MMASTELAGHSETGRRDPGPAGPRRRTQPRDGVGFWIAAAAFLVAMAFSTVPTPLYVLYARRDHFGSFMVTVVFALYAVGVIAGLLLAGHVSDWAGRRRVLGPALAIEAAAAVIFLVWRALPGLAVARVVSGIGIGMTTATATAYLRDLHARKHPKAGTVRFEIVSTAANLGGLGIGTLVSGALAQFTNAALGAPFIVFAVALVAAVLALGLAPETVLRVGRRPPYRPQRLSFGHGAARSTTIMGAAGAFVGFAVFGLFTSLAPVFVGSTLHDSSHLLAGVVPFVTFAAAALAQTVTGRLDNRVRTLVGVAAQAVGLVVVAVAMEHPDLVAFVGGGGLAGAGAGVLFKAALAAYVAPAAPARRGQAASSVFVLAYLGLIVPVLGVGIATLFVTAQTAVLFFTGALLVVLTAIVVLALRQPRAPETGHGNAIRRRPSRFSGTKGPQEGTPPGTQPGTQAA